MGARDDFDFKTAKRYLKRGIEVLLLSQVLSVVPNFDALQLQTGAPPAAIVDGVGKRSADELRAMRDKVAKRRGKK